MAVRFRKSVSLGKGARINFGKSRPSLSLGPRGASISIGKRGVYANVGIPGTGISFRTKLSGSSKKKSNSKSRSKKSTSQCSYTTKRPKPISPEKRYALDAIDRHRHGSDILPIEVGINELGEAVFLYTDTEEIIDDIRIIKELKKMPVVKYDLSKLAPRQKEIWDKIQSNSEEASREFIEIYKLAPKLLNEEEFRTRMDELKQTHYVRESFPKPRPTEESIRTNLEQEAATHVKGILLKKMKISSYIKDNWDTFSANELKSWEEERNAFEAEQDVIEVEENKRLEEEYNDTKLRYEQAFSDDEEVIVNLVEDWLIDLTIPANVAAQLDYYKGSLYVDLDLPEIEDLPSTKPKQLKSGQVKIVNKTQKELKQEYASCVLGLAFFIAANIFNLNINVQNIVISGYTQRRNRSGDISDDYIYSVIFPREQLSTMQIKDPQEDILQFENRMRLSTAFTFSKIKPFDMPSD